MRYLEAERLYTTIVKEVPVEYVIRYTSRATRVSLRISPDHGAMFIVPTGWRQKNLDFTEFLNSKAEWVLQQLRQVEDIRRQASVVNFIDGSTITVLGNPIVLRIERWPEANSAMAELRGSELRLAIPDDSQRTVKQLFSAWCLAQAKEVIPPRVAELNAEGLFSYSKIGIRNQRSRWGSCSRQGTLSFNWRLILAPPNVMDYVIYHELAHLIEMNHSVRFWRIVERHFPEFRAAEQWLKYNGKSLFW